MYHDNEEWCKIWRGPDLSFQSWHEEFEEFWPEHSKFSKINTLMASFLTKYIMFEPNKYRGVIFDGTKDLQNLKGNWLVFYKMTWGIW